MRKISGFTLKISYMGVSWGFQSMGHPNGCIVYFMENPKIKWMRTPNRNLHFGKPPYRISYNGMVVYGCLWEPLCGGPIFMSWE
jgi:hypothetical protein